MSRGRGVEVDVAPVFSAPAAASASTFTLAMRGPTTSPTANALVLPPLAAGA